MQVIRFIHSDKKNLERAFIIREKVFIVEQEVDREEEFDEFEKSSVHFLAIENDKALGTARWRISENGIKLERFAVLSEERGKGIGDLLVKAVLKDIPLGYPVYMHAQVNVLPFYEKNHFVKSGDMFSECNIDHYKMVLDQEKYHRLSLQDSINYVKDFHESFKLPVFQEPVTELDEDLIALRHRLMHEENEEYLHAAREKDLVEVADALGDMLYILCGTIITHGMQHKIEEVYSEIQRSNMSKLDKDGNPIYREDGKVMKSDLYFKPDIEGILNS